MQMRKMQKRVVTMMLGMAMVFVCQPMLHVSASDGVTGEEASDKEIEMMASYDMEMGGTQNFEWTDAEGETVMVTVSELPSRERVANGTYQISYTSPTKWEAGYKITVSNNKITSAFGQYYETYSGTITSDKLKIDSNTQASYTFKYERFWGQSTRGVSSVLNGTKIDISAI